MYRQKFTNQVKVLDGAAGRIHAVVSTESMDRDGDIIRQSGWQLERFNTHPVLLSSHNYGSLRSQIGEWESMKIVKNQLEGTARYYVGEGNEEADWGYNLAAKGMAAFSVGFIPDMTAAKEIKGQSLFPNYEFTKQELLEVSHVTIPSNAQALQAMKSLNLAPEVQQTIDAALEEMSPTDIPGHEDLLRELMPAIQRYIDDEAMPHFMEMLGSLHRSWLAMEAKDPDPGDDDDDDDPDLSDEDREYGEDDTKALVEAIHRGIKNGLKEALHG